MTTDNPDDITGTGGVAQQPTDSRDSGELDKQYFKHLMDILNVYLDKRIPSQLANRLLAWRNAYADRLATKRAIEEASSALVLSAGMETLSQFAHYQEERIAELKATLKGDTHAPQG